MITCAMVFGVMIENIRSASAPGESVEKVNSSEIKSKIQKAGIIPQKAKYWKGLPN